MTVRKYHPVLVALHWLVGVLVVVQLTGGYFVVSRIPNTDPTKLDTLKFHMLAGMFIFVLMVIRFITRLRTTHPEPTASQTQGIGRLFRPVHLAFYAVILAVVGSGWYTGLLISDVYATPGALLPADFATLPSRISHGWLALALFLLIVLHVAAAIKERMTGDKIILGRMWFGKRSA